MTEYQIPYAKSQLSFEISDDHQVEWIAPTTSLAYPYPEAAVKFALEHPTQDFKFQYFSRAKSAAIAISDKTRPVPHQFLLPPLLEKIEALGVPRSKITLIIATGTHRVMPVDEYPKILPKNLIDQYRVICHNSRDRDNLVHLGVTSRGTPVRINRSFYEAELRIVVGNIEPHQFEGFSGGYKSAAIGLGGLETINTNHAMMLDPNARLGEFDLNPARQDVEEIGKMAGVQLALNAVLNEDKEIVHVLAGTPGEVMQLGIPLSRQVCQVKVEHPYDLVIASPGGYPKDINIYQAQKGLSHARIITKAGGTVILAAACQEGSGSPGYEEWMQDKLSYQEILDRFAKEGFRIGPHKAYQIARDASQVNLLWFSELDYEFARRLLLNPVRDFQKTVIEATRSLKPGSQIGLMPRAASTIPYLETNL